ncbi:MAG: NADPH-dependent glutamate synthase [Kiritimatiellae bacterium]|nr:NADPH-dependent glutamate synthase [Kiritimatiellia bacterium]
MADNLADLEEAARAGLAALGDVSSLKAPQRTKIAQRPMPSQSAGARIRNMGEVALGYTESMARLEAQRCLQCPAKPCTTGCPVKIDIPRFVKAIAEGDDARAIAVIKEESLLPSVCGRVCPQERQCMKECTVGKIAKDPMKSVAIGRLERYVADKERESGAARPPQVAPPTGKRVAVVGSGPASLAFAADVRRAGHEVVVFEALHKCGGVLSYGIPEFRLPKAIVEKEVDGLRAMGVEIRTNFVVGRSRPLAKLLGEDGFDAAFVGSGAGLPRFMDIPGENLVGVFSANEYLTRSNLMKAFDEKRASTPYYHAKRVAVLGGGNVAMDAARTALRLGAEKVMLVYRRTEAEMPARAEEVEHAKEEGVEFHVLCNPVKIVGDENDVVTGMEVLRYELGEPDASGRRSPVPVPGSEFTLETDCVIVAIGNSSNPLVPQTTPDIEPDKKGRIVVDENHETTMRNVFAGGDIVLGAATVILAMGEGRAAARACNARLAE